LKIEQFSFRRRNGGADEGLEFRTRSEMCDFKSNDDSDSKEMKIVSIKIFLFKLFFENRQMNYANTALSNCQNV